MFGDRSTPCAGVNSIASDITGRRATGDRYKFVLLHCSNLLKFTGVAVAAMTAAVSRQPQLQNNSTHFSIQAPIKPRRYLREQAAALAQVRLRCYYFVLSANGIDWVPFDARAFTATMLIFLLVCARQLNFALTKFARDSMRGERQWRPHVFPFIHILLLPRVLSLSSTRAALKTVAPIDLLSCEEMDVKTMRSRSISAEDSARKAVGRVMVQDEVFACDFCSTFAAFLRSSARANIDISVFLRPHKVQMHAAETMQLYKQTKCSS